MFERVLKAFKAFIFQDFSNHGLYHNDFVTVTCRFAFFAVLARSFGFFRPKETLKIKN